MIVKEKKVYYCDHCKRHGLRRNAIEMHERVCTLNPTRHCRWKSPALDEQHSVVDLARLVEHLQLVARPHLVEEDVEWLRGEVGGCPACMLAAFRQSGLDYLWAQNGSRLWDYDEEIKRFRAEEREEWQQQEYRDLQGLMG